MSANRMWFRVEWRGRWRALVGLMLLLAFATVAVETTVAGARRASTAMDRLLEPTEPATAMVLLNQGQFDWDIVRAMPQVDAVAAFAVTGFDVGGIGDHPEIDAGDIGIFPFVDHEMLDTIERPFVLDGRLADPTRVDEVTVSPKFVSYFGRGVGDTVSLHLPSPEQLDVLDDEPPPQGPAIEATIVGVIRSPWLHDEADRPQGGVFATAGLYERYPDNVVGTTGAIHVNALVRLHDGAAGLKDFEREFTLRTGIENADFQDLDAEAQHTRDVTLFESRALLLLALTALVASLVLLGVAISRYCAASFVDLEVLRAFGLTPAQTRLAVALGPTSAAIGGAALAGAVSFWASRWMPVGTASLVEPSPGTSFDAFVLLPPLVVVPALTAAGCLLSLRARRRSISTAAGVSFVETATSSWPLTVGLGTRFAISGGTTRNSMSARPTLVAAALGVTGVVAALTFAHGVADATDGFERFGQTYELATFLGANGADFPGSGSALTTIADDPDIDGVLDATNDVARVPNGSVSVFGAAPVGDPIDIVVAEGRLPSTASEIALAPLSADQEHVGVGDTIAISGSHGERTLTVTGIAFVPAAPHNGYASGAWVQPETFRDLFDGFRFHFGLASTAPGTDPQAVAARLADDDVYVDTGPIIPPTERSELAELRTLPMLLATFLAVLGVGAVAHTLASTARRRRHDIAMLRAFGMRPRESGSIVFFQGGAIATIGIAIGVPVGVIVGRSVWRSVALDTPIQFVVPDSVSTVVLTALAVVAVTAMLAVWPSRRLASMQLATELRTE